MASAFGTASTCGIKPAPAGVALAAPKKHLSLVSTSLVSLPRKVRPQRKCSFRVNAAKELHFNKDGSAIRKLQVSCLTNI